MTFVYVKINNYYGVISTFLLIIKFFCLFLEGFFFSGLGPPKHSPKMVCKFLLIIVRNSLRRSCTFISPVKVYVNYVDRSVTMVSVFFSFFYFGVRS